MSIHVYWELFRPRCDCCHTTMGAEYSEAAAWDAMERAGWGTQSVPAAEVGTSKEILYRAAAEEGTVTVDLCALCVREGKRYEDRPKPIFPPGGYRRFGK